MSIRFLIPAAALLVGCAASVPLGGDDLVVPPDRVSAGAERASIVHSSFSVSRLVTNGSGYEFVSIRIPSSVTTVVVPEGSVVLQETERELADIYLKKTLSYVGHPARRMSMETERGKMGIVVKVYRNTLMLSTYGGWGSIEGGQNVKLAIVVPAEVRVRRYQPGSEISLSDVVKSGYRPINTYPDAEHLFESFAASE